MNLWSIISPFLAALCGHRYESHVLMQKWGAKHITLRSKGMQHGFRCVFVYNILKHVFLLVFFLHWPNSFFYG